MKHTSRILIIGLLALIQSFAPLVHAHAGGRQSPEGEHIPGLKFLAVKHIDSVQSCQSGSDSLGVLVSPAPGFSQSSNRAVPFPDPEMALPAPTGLFFRPFPTRKGM